MTEFSQHQPPPTQTAIPAAPPTHVPNPWYNRLGYIIGSFLFGQLAISMWQDQPEENGWIVAAVIACAILIGALRDSIKNPALKAKKT